jgi:hypothetical protein
MARVKVLVLSVPLLAHGGDHDISRLRHTTRLDGDYAS